MIRNLRRLRTSRNSLSQRSLTLKLLRPEYSTLDASFVQKKYDGSRSNENNNRQRTTINFNDSQIAHGGKNNSDLLRSLVVYRTCRFHFVLKHAHSLLALSYRLMGSKVTNALVKATFFGHFCAGENLPSLRPRLDAMRRDGVGGILDYAAEADVSNDEADNVAVNGKRPQPFVDQPARTYEYKSEVQCDRHVETFESCVRAVRDVSPDGFAAIKVTALANPVLLERVSNSVTEIKALFERIDHDGDGRLTMDELEEGCVSTFGVVPPDVRASFVEKMKSDETEIIDYAIFSSMVTPWVLPQLTRHMRDKESPLYFASPTSEEICLLDAMYSRAHRLAKLASSLNVRLLFDAEQSYYQPAIDVLVLDLQRTYNQVSESDHPIVFHTYQCYLKDVLSKLETDVRRADRESYHFGAKMVRGAYMHSERERAIERGLPSPIHETLEDTHACYDRAIEYLLRHKKETGSSLEIMCASHNQRSIEKLIALMNGLNIKDSNAVHFAQLLGMSDNLTYALGRHGFKSYKYVPYGKVEEVMPYLMRRLEENSTPFGNVENEERMIWTEIKRRVFT